MSTTTTALARLAAETRRRAQATGQDRALDLRGGARIAYRCRDGVVTLTISRKLKPLGDVELITFKRDCGVPDDATRIPAEGQGVKARDGATWHYVSFRWSEP